MSKLVVKTALITLAVLVFLTATLFGCFAIFYPKPIGEMAENVGSLKVICWAYSKQYELDNSKMSEDEVNRVYTKYALNLIDEDKYKKAIDYIIQAKEDNKIFGNDVFLIVILKLEKLKDKQQDHSEEIIYCIDRLNEKLA